MSIDNNQNSDTFSFIHTDNSDNYIDKFITNNIYNSLNHYQKDKHFKHLSTIYNNNELTNTINLVIKDINLNYLKKVISEGIKWYDISHLNDSLYNTKEGYRINNKDLMYIFDTATNGMKSILELLNKYDLQIDDIYQKHIIKYLMMLDVVSEIDIIDYSNINIKNKEITFNQPFIRYSQIHTTVNNLMLDENFNKLDLLERKIIYQKMISYIKSCMMNDIVLSEIKRSNLDNQIFKLKYLDDEFYIISNMIDGTCELFKIRYSEYIDNEYAHKLNDLSTKYYIGNRFGTITNRYVIYRGEDTTIDNIKYLNVENYLKSLKTK